MPDENSNPIGDAGRSTDRDSNPRAADGASSPGDSSLLERIRLADQSAMAMIFDRYGRLVYSIALRILKDPGHAEDVMQEVFLQVWRRPDLFVEGRGSLAAWLVVSTRNRAIDVLRRRRPADSVEDVMLASPGDLASEAEHKVLVGRVRQILQSLPPEQQKSMELAFFEGLSHSEIAERTGDPLGTVKTRIRLALNTLRKAFQA